MADVSKALNIVRKLNPLGFYSKAAEEAARLPQAKGTPEQMRAMLLKQGGKPDELKWTGFDDWAKGKKSITKDEAVQFLEQNRVQVGEKTLGGKSVASHIEELDNGGFAVVDDQGRVISDVFPTRREARPAFDAMLRDDPTKFDQYTLPGGENYREVLLTRPKEYRRFQDEVRKYGFDNVENVSPRDLERAGAPPELVERFNASLPNRDNGYYSSHWDEPNVLAHLRLKDRVGPNGEKILHVEEIQSDWAQEGRKKGFKGDEPRIIEDNGRFAVDGINRWYETPEQARQFYEERNVGLPKAPYVDSTQKWTDLALKRALREAAEGNYDALAWTPGAEQAKRYDLSKQVDNLLYKQNPDGTYRLSAQVQGRGQELGASIKPEDLERYVGKEVAERIVKNEGKATNLGGSSVSQPADMWGELSGEGLRVGGEGMIGYYDKIVPTQLQKLAKGLDPEARFGTVEIPTTTQGKRVGDLTDAELMWELNPAHSTPATTPQSMTLPSLNLTPAMREKIKEGLPLFTMMPAAVGLGASQVQEGANPANDGVDAALDVVRRAAGGRLLEDRYPSHYLPNVGRQVMADGGEPTEEYVSPQARMRQTIANIQPDAPEFTPEERGRMFRQAVENYQRFPVRRNEAELRAYTPTVREQIGQTISGDEGERTSAGRLRSAAARFAVGITGLEGSGMGIGVADVPMLTGVPLMISDIAGSAAKGNYGEAALGAALPVAFYARRPLIEAGRRAVDIARDVVGRVPAPVAAGAAGAAAMTPEDAEAAKFRAPKGVTQILAGTPENTAINAREALKRVVSPFSEDPESVRRALEIAASYRIPQGTEFNVPGSFFKKKPTMGVHDVRADIAPLPGVTPLVPRQMSWEDFAKEAKGGTLINVGGDRLNLGLLRDINNEKKLAWDVPLHAGPKYMLEPNPGLVWANALGHTTSFNNIISDAVKKGPVYGVYAPMGPTAVDSSVGMFNALMSQIPASKITKKAAKDFDEMVRSGQFTIKAEDRPKTAELMSKIWPGLNKLKDQADVLAVAQKMTGTQRGDFAKAMEATGWRKQGFPEVGTTRVAVTDPSLLSAPTNTIGHRVVRFDTSENVSPTRLFPHQTYPAETLGRYVADLPLVQTQYGMPTAMERILSKPAAGGQIVHPYSLDRAGRDTARKLFTEQKQTQPVDDRLIESIMLGLQRQKEYGFRRGGGVSHHAMMLAKELGSSPRETVHP